MYLKLFLPAVLLLASGNSSANGQGDIESTFKYVLDGIVQLMEGSGTIDQDLYDSLIQCFEDTDPGLLDAVNGGWEGMIDYAAAEGADGDPWLGCDEAEGHSNYAEFDCTLQENGALPIYEPCCYASNVAIYHTVLEICFRETWSIPNEYVKALVQQYAFMAFASHFYHGSETDLALRSDVRFADLGTFTAYQAAVSGLAPLNSPVIHDLSRTPRSKTAYESVAALQDMLANVPVESWGEMLDDVIDAPGTVLTVAATAATVFATVMGEEELVSTVEGLADSFALSADERDFLLDDFLPAIESATASVAPGPQMQKRILGGFFGMFAKFLYGALWQEEFIPNPFIYQPSANIAAARVLPKVNTFANSLQDEGDFPHYNQDFQLGVDVYPGESRCNPSYKSPHAKWHLQAGIGDADEAHLADLIYQVLPQEDADDDDGGAAISSSVLWGPVLLLLSLR